MKHAILVIGYGEKAAILQETINILDNEDIDFFIHWDKRYALPNLKSNYSKIYFIKDRIKVKWGSFTQIKAEKKLLKSINKEKYQYVHLISSNDMPLMTPDYFKKYFKNEAYIGFVVPVPKDAKLRVQYYYPSNVDFRELKLIRVLFDYINKLFRINRLKNKELKIYKGPNWFSLKTKYITNLLLDKWDNIFKHSFCGDEEYTQTILQKFCAKGTRDDCTQAARYIDWKRGRPYTFQITDVQELVGKVNTEYAFARKVKDPLIVSNVFKKFKQNN